MLLFPRNHVAGTHGAVFVLAALAHAHAAQRDLGEMAVRFRIGKIGLHRDRLIARAQAQVFVQRVGVDLLPRIHLPFRVPYALVFAEGLHHLGPEHPDQQFAARLAVAVLAGERSAQHRHKVRGLFHEGAKIPDALFAHQVEIDPHVHAGLAKMPVKRAVIAVLGQQPVQSAQVLAQLFRRHRRILPAFPCLGFARHL